MRALLVAMLLLFGPAATISFAIPTGLNAMPTANVLGMGATRVEYGFNGSGLLYATPETATIVGTQTGLVLGLEGGIDRVDDVGTVYNVKWRLKNEGLLAPAFAVGVQNIVSGERPQYYGVFTKSIISSRLAQISAGLMLDEDIDTLGMLGAGLYLGPLTLKADTIQGGGQDRTSVGAGLTFAGISFSAAYFAYDTLRPDETTFTVSYNSGSIYR